MPKKLDFKNLRKCLDNYQPEFLYIRLRGSAGGDVKVNERLENKKLDFKKDKSGLFMLIDSEVVFHFPLKDYQKGFSLAYRRIEPTESGIGKLVTLSTEIDPYDPALPEPEKSTLRTVLDCHLMEIDFTGRINLKFHSWCIKPHWKYWTIDKPRNIQ